MGHDDMQSLMAAAQTGDQKAYAAVLAYARSWCARFFARRTPPGAADDLVQETLMAIHAKRHTFDPSLPFGPWLATIARRKWIDYLRQVTRRAEVDLPETVEAETEEDALAAHLSLEKLLARLKPGQAQVIRLVKIDGLAVEEAASRSGQSPALVRVNIHRGLKRLAALVES
jgi:RNA polymerase sigma factor (sigma-70 family)